MFKALFLGFALLLALPLALLCVVLAPLLLVACVLRVVFGLVFLPFRLLGAGVSLLAGLVGFVIKALVLLVVGALFVVLIAGGALAFVALPLAAIALAVWFVVKLFAAGSTATA